MNLFGKKKAEAPKPNAAEAIIALRSQLDILEKREAHILKKIEVTMTEAKLKASKKDKSGALFALKRKKMYEQEVAKLQGAKISLESQALALENAAVNVEILKAMKSGATAMSAVRGNIDAGTVDDIMDDIQEEKDIADQISEAISRPGQQLFEDDDLLAELQELEELSALEVGETVAAQKQPSAPATVFNLPSVPSNVALPVAPTGPVAVAHAESEEERLLRELQASMI